MNAAQRRKSKRAVGRELSDMLTMLASQLREHVENPANGPPLPPLPWTFDDWLTEYRRWHEQTRASRSRR